MATGAAVGTVIAPGPGTVVGALLGAVADHFGLSIRNKKRVFLSFDYRHDRRVKTLFVGQCRHPGTPFEIVDHSLQEAAPEAEWESHAAEAIGASDLVVVLLGEHTWRSEGVRSEVYMARRLGVPVVQVYGYQDQRGLAVAGAGRCYLWEWATLGRILD